MSSGDTDGLIPEKVAAIFSAREGSGGIAPAHNRVATQQRLAYSSGLLVVTGREKKRCDNAGDQEQFGLHGRVCLSWFCERVLSLFTLLFAIGAAYLPDEFAIMS